uniref:Uncharacterized protein n=1 Tax=Rhizophora mucronata TaxID=61149 RepID=A0A2P2Q6I1_RHIMU
MDTPLTNVNTIAPPIPIIVPSILAFPAEVVSPSFSNLNRTAKTKVTAGMRLVIAVANVADVNTRLSKYKI